MILERPSIPASARALPIEFLIKLSCLKVSQITRGAWAKGQKSPSGRKKAWLPPSLEE